MKAVLCWLTIIVMTANGDDDPAANQLVAFRNKTLGPVGIMSTANGAPINCKDASSTLNRRLIFHEYFMDSITHLNRERLPPRIVHAKGSGAFGYFEVTHDIKDICKAKFLGEVGKITPIAVRFSPVVQEVGGIDTSRDARGFSIKFYTEDGNFDIVGFNTPIFVIKDPLFFSTFVHTRKRNPQTFLYDSNMFWDFIVLRPECMYIYMYIFGDTGIPNGYRHMPGYGIHTYQVINELGEKHFVRFHFIPDAGVKNLGSSKAQKIAAVDPDYANRDLFNAIVTGNFPSWTVSIQVLSESDVKNAEFDVFDITRILPEDHYPLRSLGRFVLNKNTENYFRDIEQLAFCPGNLVPGILGAPDKIFEARRLSYRDAQYYRLGANFEKIDVNSPVGETFTYNRDGKPPVKYNQGNIPNYYPNSFNGPVPYIEANEVDLIYICEAPPDNFEQARELYNEMTSDERTRLVENVVNSLSGVTDKSTQDRSVKLLEYIHTDFGNRVREGLIQNKTTFY